MKVPFMDLHRQYVAIEQEIIGELNWVLENSAFVLGKKVYDFEKAFAGYCEVEHCIACNSGTSALHLALIAAGVGPGDEVITVPNTFIATCEAISYTGARPVFVDVNPKTYNIDVSKVEVAITPKTKAIIPVHLFGQPVDMDPILDIATKHKLIVIEDSCQAHGARYKGRRVGSIGDLGCFSFYPGKNLGAYGEGGAVVTNNDEYAHKIRMLRDHGSPKKYHHNLIGFNYRMSGIQGAVLGVKLKYLDQWNEKRRQFALLYNQLLAETEVVTPFVPEWAEPVFHLYVIRSKWRNELQAFLSQHGVATGLHYPVPIHLQPAFQFLGYGIGDFPVTERLSSEILSLPMYPELSEKQIWYTCNLIRELLPTKTFM